MSEEEEFEFRHRLEQEQEGPGMAVSAAAGVGKGVGTVALNAQRYVGKGLAALPGNLAQAGGNWLTADAESGLEKLKGELAPYKAANPISAAAGELGGEIAATLPVGGFLAKGASVLPGASKVPGLIEAIKTSGMSGGNLIAKTAGGAITGGASASLVDPNAAGTGAAIGAAIPGGVKLAGLAGDLVGQGVRKMVGSVSPEVTALAERAKQLGIDIPADRLTNSKPLNAIAAGLNYVPFSGRAATEAKMGEQLNQAASKLMGQNTPNINKALRAASEDLGAKFDRTLQSTGVAFDKQLLEDVSRIFNTAEGQLGKDALRPISSQVDELISKGASGTIDGQAAYNIKRTLDRIGRGNGPEAYHALELKGVLMDALDRSLGSDGAKAFAKTREQYGNMLALEKIAKNGVEGDISVARLANMTNINNKPLQELADIAAQFVKPREGQHGAAQRAFAGMGVGAVAGPGAALGGIAAGRLTNSALNSNALRSIALGERNPSALLQLLEQSGLPQMGYRAAPIGAAQ